MHPKIESLAELVDTVGVDTDPALRTHVETCANCQAQVSQLRMLALAGGSRSVEPLPERGGHVTDEEIIGYVNTTLNAEKHAHIKRHLHACGRCMKEVLLYRSHLAQARLAQNTEAISDVGGTRSWLAKRGTWLRSLFQFNAPATVWMGVAGAIATAVVLANMQWLSDPGAPTARISQTSEAKTIITADPSGSELASLAAVPEGTVASGQAQGDANQNVQQKKKAAIAPVMGTAPPVATTIPLEQLHGESAVAVVIGNKSYVSGGLVDAKYALQDAQSIKTWLVSTLGVAENNIIYLENATSAQFNEVFGNSDNPTGKLASAVKAGVSDVFIYYSGHGAPDIGTKRGYFVPVDADPSFIALSGYAVDTLFNNLAQLGAHSVTVVLDTNFSGNSAGGTLLKNVSPALVKTEQVFPKLSNVTIFSGADQGQVNAWYSGQAHSLFTYLFLKGLAGSADGNHDGNISALELQKYLQHAVPYEARRLGGAEQTPVLTQTQDRVLVNLH